MEKYGHILCVCVWCALWKCCLQYQLGLIFISNMSIQSFRRVCTFLCCCCCIHFAGFCLSPKNKLPFFPPVSTMLLIGWMSTWWAIYNDIYNTRKHNLLCRMATAHTHSYFCTIEHFCQMQSVELVGCYFFRILLSTRRVVWAKCATNRNMSFYWKLHWICHTHKFRCNVVPIFTACITKHKTWFRISDFGMALLNRRNRAKQKWSTQREWERGGKKISTATAHSYNKILCMERERAFQDWIFMQMCMQSQ